MDNILKIGVIGATGFIGDRVIHRLMQVSSFKIIPIIRNAAYLARFQQLQLPVRFADAMDETALIKALSGCDMVIHCAAGDSWFIRQSAALTYKAAHHALVKRMIYISTASVHGQAPITGTNEDQPLSNHQFVAYNNAKVDAETTLLQLRQNRRTEIVILRPGIVFGPGCFWTVGFANSIKNNTAYLVNNGNGICNSIYVDNLVEAIRLALLTPNIDKEAFIVGDQETATWADLYRPVAEALGKKLGDINNITLTSYTPNSKEKIKQILRSSTLISPYFALRSRLTMGRHITPYQSPLNFEMASLYLCHYKLPNSKAINILAYKPTTTFNQGCEYTVAKLISDNSPL